MLEHLKVTREEKNFHDRKNRKKKDNDVLIKTAIPNRILK